MTSLSKVPSLLTRLNGSINDASRRLIQVALLVSALPACNVQVGDDAGFGVPSDSSQVATGTPASTGWGDTEAMSSDEDSRADTTGGTGGSETTFGTNTSALETTGVFDDGAESEESAGAACPADPIMDNHDLSTPYMLDAVGCGGPAQVVQGPFQTTPSELDVYAYSLQDCGPFPHPADQVIVTARMELSFDTELLKDTRSCIFLICEDGTMPQDIEQPGYDRCSPGAQMSNELPGSVGCCQEGGMYLSNFAKCPPGSGGGMNVVISVEQSPMAAVCDQKEITLHRSVSLL